jgi:hypothetical protein
VRPENRQPPSCGVAAALGPADVRHESHAHAVQPRALLARGPVDVRLGPAPRPEVLVAVEARGPEPVLPRERVRVADPQPPLLRAVDQEQPAERPERLPPERRLRLLVDDDHAPAGVGQLGGRDQPGEAGPDDDRVGAGCAHAARKASLSGTRAPMRMIALR